MSKYKRLPMAEYTLTNLWIDHEINAMLLEAGVILDVDELRKGVMQRLPKTLAYLKEH